jgi:ankyrin repeat protein
MHGHCDVVKCLLSSGADINLCDKQGQSSLFVAPELSKHLTTSQCSHIDAPELNKHLTTSQCSSIDATNNGDCPCLSHKLISASERLSKH